MNRTDELLTRLADELRQVTEYDAGDVYLPVLNELRGSELEGMCEEVARILTGYVRASADVSRAIIQHPAGETP